MNVKQLKDWLSQFPDDMEVKFGDHGGEVSLDESFFRAIEVQGLQALVIPDYEWLADDRIIEWDKVRRATA